MFNAKKYLLPIIALACAAPALAQPAEGAKFYKLDFVVKEVDGGKTVNARNFSTMLATYTAGANTPQASIRAGVKVPVTTGNSTQFFDLGVNLDVRELRERQGEVSLYITADITTIAQDNAAALPVTRQNRWTGGVVLPVKKAVVVFASDDISSKRQLQLELTATPITSAPPR